MITRIMFWASAIAAIAIGVVMVAAAFGIVDTEWQQIVLLGMVETGLATVVVCRFLLGRLDKSP